MVKVVCVSDTHGYVPRAVPRGDVLVHAGDGAGSYDPAAGCRDSITALRRWMGALPHPHKVYVPGNHDGVFAEEPAWAREFMAEEGIEVLVDREVSMAGLRLYGSPWCPEFGNWWFMVPAARRREAFALIPDGLDVLVTHTPPYGVLDWRHRFKAPSHLGCEELAMRLELMDHQPRLHVFGHIHGGYGIQVDGAMDPYPVHVNAAYCDEAYRPVNAVQVVELELHH